MAETTQPQVRVGVGVFVFRNRSDPDIILGKRKGALGSGTWALPGGHLEYGETFSQCAYREVKEETGLEVTDVKFLTAVESIWPEEGKQYVTIFMTAFQKDGNERAEVIEPEKCERWITMALKTVRLREQRGEKFHGGCGLFAPISNLIEQRPEVWMALEQQFLPEVTWNSGR